VTSFFRYGGVLTLGAVLSAPAALAAQIDVMAIGDSITWGFRSGASGDQLSNGGWRVPLNTQLDALGSDTYNFIGVKGDDNHATVTGEKSGDSQRLGEPYNGDGPDGIGSNTALHHGYSGWVIDAQPYFDSGAYVDNNSDLVSDSNNRSGITQHLTATNPTTGTIDPSTADVVMLSIGINDVIEYTSFTNSPYSSINDMVVNLGSLIDTIAGAVPTNTTVLVSNLLPLAGDPFGSTNSNTIGGEAGVEEFNSLLFDQFFGDNDGDFDETFLSDSLGDEVYASHSSLSNVFLLNAFSSVLDENGDVISSAFVGDNVHPTDSGYRLIAEFYAERFEAGAFPVPEPGTAVLMVLGGALLLGRRRRAA